MSFGVEAWSVVAEWGAKFWSKHQSLEVGIKGGILEWVVGCGAGFGTNSRAMSELEQNHNYKIEK